MLIIVETVSLEAFSLFNCYERIQREKWSNAIHKSDISCLKAF